MEVVNVKNARSIWLFDLRDLNPRGLSPVPFFFAVKDRYHFLGWPQTPDELSWTISSPKGIKFTDGAFPMDNNSRSVSATFYNDGVMADTGFSTAHSDSFLENLLSFASQYFGIEYRAEMVHKRRYVSEMVVRSERDLSTASTKLATFAARFNQLVNLDGELFYMYGFELKKDPGSVNGPLNPTFKFERETGRELSEQRYYSLAPVKTEVHEQLLQDFESIMAG